MIPVSEYRFPKNPSFLLVEKCKKSWWSLLFCWDIWNKKREKHTNFFFGNQSKTHCSPNWPISGPLICKGAKSVFYADTSTRVLSFYLLRSSSYIRAYSLDRPSFQKSLIDIGIFLADREEDGSIHVRVQEWRRRVDREATRRRPWGLRLIYLRAQPQARPGCSLRGRIRRRSVFIFSRLPYLRRMPGIISLTFFVPCISLLSLFVWVCESRKFTNNLVDHHRNDSFTLSIELLIVVRCFAHGIVFVTETSHYEVESLLSLHQMWFSVNVACFDS